MNILLLQIKYLNGFHKWIEKINHLVRTTEVFFSNQFIVPEGYALCSTLQIILGSSWELPWL